MEGQRAPIDEVMDMMRQGSPNSEIIAQLQGKGYSNVEIQEALNQAQTKASIETAEQDVPSPPEPEMQPSMLNSTFSKPIPQTQVALQQPAYGNDMSERIEEIAESIIDEKWQKIMEDVGDIPSWKERVRTEIISIKQEVLRIENRFETLQQSILGRIKEYDRGVEDLGTDIKAVEKLLQNILQPLTNNVKELQRVTERLKK